MSLEGDDDLWSPEKSYGYNYIVIGSPRTSQTQKAPFISQVRPTKRTNLNTTLNTTFNRRAEQRRPASVALDENSVDLSMLLQHVGRDSPEPPPPEPDEQGPMRDGDFDGFWDDDGPATYQHFAIETLLDGRRVAVGPQSETRAQCTNAYSRIVASAMTRRLDRMTTGAGPDLQLASGGPFGMASLSAGGGGRMKGHAAASRMQRRPRTAMPASPERRSRVVYDGSDSPLTGKPHKMRYANNRDPLVGQCELGWEEGQEGMKVAGRATRPPDETHQARVQSWGAAFAVQRRDNSFFSGQRIKGALPGSQPLCRCPAPLRMGRVSTGFALTANACPGRGALREPTSTG